MAIIGSGKKKMWFCVNIIDLRKCTDIYNETQYVDLKGSHHTPNFHNFDDVILNLHIDYSDTLLTFFVFQLLVYLPLASFFFYYYLSVILHLMKAFRRKHLCLIVPCVSSYRSEHFPRSVVFCQLHQPLFTYSCGFVYLAQ